MNASAPASSLPPDRLRDHVRLACLPGIGARTRRELLARYGSPEAVLAAPPGELTAIPGAGRRLAKALPGPAEAAAADEVLALCHARGVRIVLDGQDGYPPLLGRIADPPSLLFVRGSIEPCDSLAIAIVGSRHATAYGRKVAWQLAGGLARAGYTIVSGLARGIDAAAHRGALDAGGRTLAVLGSGVLNIYPPEHADLAMEVTARGALIGEAPPLAAPARGCFPQRNRIVSGLALGVVVVEAADHSGALITARLAGEQGREVFAVPGPIDSRMSRGCHALLRDGARLVQGVDDVLEELGPLCEAATAADGREVRSPAELQLGDVERQVLAACDAEADASRTASIDDVAAASGLATSQVLATLGVLEMRRVVRRLPGNRVARA
ncbi:MAG: DNA-processing protein DprA [Planctomycetia bacterium]